MSFFDFDYKAYHRQVHGMQDDASTSNSDTEIDHPASSSPSDNRQMSAVLQGLRNLGIEHRQRVADDGPQIGRSSFAGSTRMDRRVRRDDMFHSTRHDHFGLWRADAPEPHDLTGYQPLPEDTDQEVTRHAGEARTEAGSSSAAAPRRRRSVLGRAGRALGRMFGTSTTEQRADPAAGRRRAREENAEEVQPRSRWVAGSSMQAEETTQPPLDPALCRRLYAEDLMLVVRAHAGCEASGAVKIGRASCRERV